MTKKIGNFLFILLLTIAIIPVVSVEAQASKTVNSQSELKAALDDTSITTIVLGQDIETTEKINIMRPVTIDGANHTIRYVGTFGSGQSSSNTVWGGIYVLQVYKTDVTIRNIKLTGGNAALLINGGTATFEGTIDVSGNGFGGIELGQGSGVDTVPQLVVSDNATIINTTESADRPTIWVPEDTDKAIWELGNATFELQAGEELTMEEINELAESTENPETNDTTIWQLTIMTFMVALIGYFVRKVAMDD